MKREIFNVIQQEINDFTNTNCSWEIKGEKYNFIETHIESGDGECHAVIVQRESDGKYFEFGWSYYRDNYYYEEEWCEVKPKVITKTIYKWFDEK